jgi:anti-sigma factor ChrR (cupin superfamily)
VRNGRDTHDDGETAALYTAGALDAEAARAFEAHLAAGCSQCASELESHAAVAGSLVFAPEPVPPPPSVRARLLATIAAEPPRDRGHDFVRENDGTWIEITPGVSRKDIGRDAGFLLRIAAGGKVPHHAHSAVEHCYVLRGTVQIAGLDLHVGDYHRAAPGSVHASIRSENGCLLLIVERPDPEASPPA